MRVVRWFGGLTLVGSLSACAGQSLEDPAEGPGTGSETDGTDSETADETDGTDSETADETDGTDSETAELSPSEACSVTPQGSLKPETDAAFRALIVGSWLLCSPESTFGTSDEQGLVIYEDFRWAKLFDQGDGELVPGVGWGLEGTWESLDTSDFNGPGVYQLNLNIDGSGTVITTPVLAEEPAYMRLNNNGTFVGDYVRL